MKALVWDGGPYPEGFQIKDVEKKSPGKNWVSIRTKLCGICGSDIGIIKRKMAFLADFLPKPLIFGHEIVGIVDEVGEGVEHLKVGDRVTVDAAGGCAELGLEPCDMCKIGLYNLCYNQAVTGGGVGYSQLNGGGFAEYFLAHKSKVYKIPDNVSDEEALLTEPLATGIHSCFKGNPSGKKVAVIGAGTIGLQLLQANRLMGADRIYVATEFEYQAKLAEQLGADKVYCLERGDLPTLGITVDSGKGVDQTYEGVGSEQTLRDAIAITKQGGHIIFVGMMGEAKIDFTMINIKELTIHGIYGYPFKAEVARSPFDIALEWEEKRKVNNRPLLSHTYKLEQWKEAFQAQLDKKKYKSTKVAFKYF
ncbi:MAG: zinc-binding dehydrogenase [Candidatus Freyarchaeota archaeon]